MPLEYLDFEDMTKLIILDNDSEDEESQLEKTTKSQCDIYYKFRYTFREDEKDIKGQKDTCRYILSLLKKFIILNKFTLGIECFKSGMEEAKPHVHIHFVSRTKKDTIIKSLKRADINDGCNLFHGNRCYALGIEVNVNEDKFFRYPFKQQKGDTYRYTIFGSFINSERAGTLRDEAYAVWITACEIQNKKNEKKEDNDQLSDRLFNYLDKLDNLDSDIKIKVAIQKFYIDEEKKPFNKTTALGYFYNYKISRKLMTHEELAKLW